MFRQFLMGAGAQALLRLVTIGTQLVLVPLLLQVWGAGLYGGWVLLESLRSMFSLADLGMAQIAANEMSAQVAAGKVDEAMRTNSAAFVLLASVSITVLCAGAGVAAFVPLELILNLPADGATASWTFFLLSGVAAGGVLFGSVAAALRAVGLFWLMSLANAANLLGFAFAAAVWSLAGYGYVPIALSMLAGQTLLFGGVWLWLVRTHPWTRPRMTLVETQRIRGMIGPSFAYLLYPLSDLLNIQGTNLVVGVVLGPAAVSVLSTVRTLARMGKMMAATLIYPLQPAFAQLSGRGEGQAMRRLHRHVVGASLIFAFLFLAAIWTVGPGFLVWWTDGVVGDQAQLLSVLSTAIALEIVWFALQTPSMSTNRHSDFALAVALASVGGLILTAGLLPTGGLLVAAWSLLAGHLAVLLFSFWRLRKVQGS